MPARDELLAEDVAAGGRGMDQVDLRWFRALASYKQTATVALLAKHGRRRGDGTARAYEELAKRLIRDGGDRARRIAAARVTGAAAAPLASRG